MVIAMVLVALPATALAHERRTIAGGRPTVRTALFMAALVASRANPIIAPYYVNYHLEHHLFFYVPCYNLPRVHEILSRGPHAGRMEVQPSYAAVLRLATAKPASEDRPGALVSSVRRVLVRGWRLQFWTGMKSE